MPAWQPIQVGPGNHSSMIQFRTLRPTTYILGVQFASLPHRHPHEPLTVAPPPSPCPPLPLWTDKNSRPLTFRGGRVCVCVSGVLFQFRPSNWHPADWRDRVVGWVALDLKWRGGFAISHYIHAVVSLYVTVRISANIAVDSIHRTMFSCNVCMQTYV